MKWTAKQTAAMKESIPTFIRCSHCDGTGRIVASSWLRERRIECGLSAREIASTLGISVQYLCDIERGRRGVTLGIQNYYLGLKKRR